MMSGKGASGGPADGGRTGEGAAEIEVLAARPGSVGRATVQRLLPKRQHRMVGAWCFADYLAPLAVAPGSGLDVGPHPHIGLHTLTWLFEGEARHRDSLGSDQLLRPGQVNLMTAGRGVVHSEEASPRYRGVLEGVQLWIAQPDQTRHGAAAFCHHEALPTLSAAGGRAIVLVGTLGEVTSPVVVDSALVGADLALGVGRSAWPLAPGFEHALLVLRGSVHVPGGAVPAGRIAFLPQGGDELVCQADEPSRALLLGGEPFGTAVLMWWNYVARTPAEIEAAHASWSAQDGRFGRVESALARIAGPARPVLGAPTGSRAARR